MTPMKRSLAFVLLPLLPAGAGAASDKPQSAEVFVTAQRTGDRLSAKAPAAFVPLPQPAENFPVIMADPKRSFQTIEGIGGALTDASAEVFAKLPKDKQEEVLSAYFDPVKGLGYSLGRTHIHSCDFSSESYTYVAEGDTELKSFSVDRDRRFRIPFIRAAMAAAKGPFKLFASPWSPPAWMKTNNDMLHGGKLKPEYADAWARYMVKFAQEYAKAGIPLWGLTVQNEPMAAQTWESCIFTAEEERDFVRDHLGPALQKAGLSGLKLMVWDHNRGIMYQRAQVVYDDPAASRYVWGAGYHWYVGDHFDNVRILHDAYPDKAVFFTEGCQGPFDEKRLDEWAWGELYAESMLHDLNNWAAGWTDWNVLLDERGGPNHVANYVFAPVHADTRTGTLRYMSSYYYIGHFSRFIRPGAKRVACTSNDDDIEAAAFLNPDGRLSVVALNRTDRAIPFQLWVAGQAASVESPAHSIVTMVVPAQLKG